mmetsp:Transcript_2586/g.4216  ORF Transcript_2586/g.4216 Transcript_2586/m.4216 type:complete len:452 (+) Transcript_2586:1-1356(+)
MPLDDGSISSLPSLNLADESAASDPVYAAVDLSDQKQQPVTPRESFGALVPDAELSTSKDRIPTVASLSVPPPPSASANIPPPSASANIPPPAAALTMPPPPAAIHGLESMNSAMSVAPLPAPVPVVANDDALLYDDDAAAPSAPHPNALSSAPQPRPKSIRSRIALTASRNWIIQWDDIEFEKKIGAGSFGEVWTAELWGMACAVKKIPDELISDEAIEDFVGELEILAGLRHPNIVLMMGAAIEPDGRMAIVSEYCPNGSAHDALRHYDVPLKTRAHLALDCAYAMLYLHKLNIVHCDLKSRNLLIDKDWNGKLCDFGLSMRQTSNRVRLAGTRGYMANELMVFYADIYDGSAEMVFTFASDVYSYGILLHELYTKQDAEDVPWANTDEELEALARGDRPDVPGTMDKAYRRLMTQCWDQDPAIRPDFRQVIKQLKAIVQDFDERDPQE